jgi:transposase
MNSETLFNMALGLHSPWEVREINFVANDLGPNELHLRLGFPPGSRFADESGVLCGVHDTVERQWQHLNFFEHTCYLHCAVPRIKTSTGKVVKACDQSIRDHLEAKGTPPEQIQHASMDLSPAFIAGCQGRFSQRPDHLRPFPCRQTAQ